MPFALLQIENMYSSTHNPPGLTRDSALSYHWLVGQTLQTRLNKTSALFCSLSFILVSHRGAVLPLSFLLDSAVAESYLLQLWQAHRTCLYGSSARSCLEVLLASRCDTKISHLTLQARQHTTNEYRPTNFARTYWSDQILPTSQRTLHSRMALFNIENTTFLSLAHQLRNHQYDCPQGLVMLTRPR